MSCFRMKGFALLILVFCFGCGHGLWAQMQTGRYDEWLESSYQLPLDQLLDGQETGIYLSWSIANVTDGTGYFYGDSFYSNGVAVVDGVDSVFEIGDASLLSYSTGSVGPLSAGRFLVYYDLEQDTFCAVRINEISGPDPLHASLDLSWYVLPQGTSFFPTTQPTLAVTQPTYKSRYVTTSSQLDVSGILAENAAVTEVRWHDGVKQSGVALVSGETWSVAGIQLVEGDNLLTFTIEDSEGNTAEDTLLVVREAVSARPVAEVAAALFNAPSLMMGHGETLSDTGQRFNHYGTYDLESADFDGDGDLDVVAGVYGGFAMLWNDGSGALSAGERQGEGIVVDVAVGDLNGDGAPDLVLGRSVRSTYLSDEIWFNDGQGGFVRSAQMLDDQVTTKVLIGDVDADGDQDVVCVGNPMTRVWINTDGSGLLTPGFGFEPGSVFDAALGDLNGDGAADLLLVLNFGVTSGFINDGAGNFPIATLEFGVESGTNVLIADLNGDQMPDVFVGGNLIGNVYLNQGNGVFSQTLSYGTAGFFQDVAAADMNGDGLLDLVTAESNKVVQLFSQGNGSFHISRSNAPGTVQAIAPGVFRPSVVGHAAGWGPDRTILDLVIYQNQL